MTDLIRDQFERLLNSLDKDSPWPELETSGYLDLLRPETHGGGGMGLEDLFPLALVAGGQPLPIVQTMVARVSTPGAVDVGDVEAELARAGNDPTAARATAATVTAGLMAGAMLKVLEITVAYASTRRQFGREIGKFQAIQHQIAVMAEEAMAAQMAAMAAFRGAPLDISVERAAVAKMRAGQAAQVVCAGGHAVHGAIGISAEHPLHHLTSRLQAWRLAHGGEAYWARRLGRMALRSAQTALDIVRHV